MTGPTITVYQDAAGQWRYRVVGGNGEPMAPSEAYTRKADAVRGAHDLVAAVGTADITFDDEGE